MMEKNKIIVIGGLSAGPSAAAKARREDENAEIILFEKGANISYATCGMPYAFSGVIEKREQLIVVKPSLLRERFNIDVKLEEEVTNINTSDKIVYTPKGTYKYDKLVFATGAKSIVPPIKNLDKTDNWSTCRSMIDYDKITESLISTNTKHITVIGGGLIGIEVAENLVKSGKKVTLIEGGEQLLNMWQPKFTHFAKTVLEEEGVEVITNTFVNEFVEENGKVIKVKVSNDKYIDTDFVIMSIGIKPNTELLLREGAAAIGNGALKVNEKMETSIADVYAAGDNVSIKNLQTGAYDYFPLGTHSNKGGRTAGANAAAKNALFRGAYKTAIVKVFKYTLARTGMNPTFMDKKGLRYDRVLSISGATPGYYPGQTDLISEIYFDPETNKILGGEFFGEEGVDKRVDVLSTAIYAGLKLEDLSQLDLAYAPPFSPAKDPIVVSGFVGENILEGKSNQMSVEELESMFVDNSINNYQLIDVRTVKEFDKATIEGSKNIALHDIRARMNELDKKVEIVLFCQKGLRGYLAEQILVQNGFKVRNLSGGFKLWDMYTSNRILAAV